MYLYDEIEHRGRKIPAHVWYETADVAYTDGGFRKITTLSAVVENADGIRSESEVTWRGTIYRIHGEPMLRVQKGQDHHWTITLQRIIG